MHPECQPPGGDLEEGSHNVTQYPQSKQRPWLGRRWKHGASGMKDLADFAVTTSDSVQTDQDYDFVSVNSIENDISSEVEDGE